MRRAAIDIHESFIDNRTMPTSNFMLPVYYLRQIADQVRDSGGDVRRWMEQNHIAESQLSDGQVLLPFATFHQLVLDARTVTGDAALGLHVGARLGVNAHGILGFAAISSATLRQTVELFERYIALRTPMVTVNHRIKGDQFQVRFQPQHPLGEIQDTVLEAVVLTVKNVLDYVTAGEFRVSRVAFSYAAPSYAPLADELFGMKVSFGESWTGFTLPLAAMDMPLKMADQLTFSEAASLCQNAFEHLERNESLTARIRKILQEQRPFPALNEVAAMFHLTPRTLHRRLLDEGTSFNEILEQVRHVLAVEYLKAGQLDMQEIAWQLGYSDLSNFRRAFKRWEGVAPSAFKLR